ncbi:hypothetical protein A2631_05765 [Candidatus Daviesbacteria bacterium RIFCSPHIGHO2_01_FULL_44_29]|uniref:Thymidylate synthase n=1 Tax=Candidatus Daviesbacteria bacterium RIFCSPHIGHO2_02_FULL_43_12 TaxID=1797776 RepID=A0A1F5KJ52_9BACT|nr:MAG: hypothetical protein A2631_05765 [Candidatus Daviesbacteria bacterium RIFCSPHIGHO2_01_FULL_44_29]OGE40641.1 MAG: hypothetical protein A3D25_05785 [Candidatus Daviesbacteria bacterium RIFCSPHIGHO2_02_FULL_43_12]
MSDLAKAARTFNPPLKEKYSKEGDPRGEEAAQEAMTRFVTNPDGAIYVMTPMVPELFSALLKARYSRTELSAKQLLWREFVGQKESIPWKKIDLGRSALDEVFNFQKAEGMAERILLQYGDDSVFELAGAHLFLDRVSLVASKVIEDARIGISPLEKSTRYVVFDQKDGNGDFSFFKDPKIMDSDLKDEYLAVNRACFELYARAVKLLDEYFRKQVPLEKQQFPDFANENKSALFPELTDERSIKAARSAYNMSIRSKACDVARCLLPASTLTNIGEFGNARAYGYLFTKMAVHPLSEMQMISAEAVRELKKVLPKFLDVVDNAHGLSYQEYLRKTDQALRKRALKLLKGIKPQKQDRVELVKLDKNPEVTIAAALLYPYCILPLKQLLKIVKELGDKERGAIIHDSLKFRTNRRHKPPRAFELPGYDLVYDLLANFGVYRDLHRQRTLTQMRQNYTTEHGYDMPVEFKELGMEPEFDLLAAQVQILHDKVIKKFPSEAQYTTINANYTRWYVGMNLREAFWFTELRSVPQGHFSYRTVAQDMYLKAQEVYPFLKGLKPTKTHYVDMSDRSRNLERMEAMQRIEVKISQIEEKYS